MKAHNNATMPPPTPPYVPNKPSKPTVNTPSKKSDTTVMHSEEFGADLPYCPDAYLAAIAHPECRMDFRPETIARKLLEIGIVLLGLGQEAAAARAIEEAAARAAARSDSLPTITFGHGDRHALESGFAVDQVEAAIRADVLAQVR